MLHLAQDILRVGCHCTQGMREMVMMMMSLNSLKTRLLYPRMTTLGNLKKLANVKAEI